MVKDHEELRQKLFKGTYYNNNADNQKRSKVKNVLIFDDGDVVIFFEGGSVDTSLKNIKPIRRPSNVIAEFEWCYILKNDKDEVVGYVGKTEESKKDTPEEKMTVEEAVEQLKDLRRSQEHSIGTDDITDNIFKKDVEAIDVALRALELIKQYDKNYVKKIMNADFKDSDMEVRVKYEGKGED